MSTQQQKKNVKGQNPQIKQTKKQSNTPNTKNKKKSRKGSNSLFKETFKVTKRELWASVDSYGDVSIMKPFTPEFYPKWFSHISKLFEAYKIKFMKLSVISNVPMTSAGSYAYYVDVNPSDRPRDMQDICAQNGHHVSWIARSSSQFYGGGMFRQQPRYLTHAADKYPFTFFMDVESKGSVQLLVYIEYSVTFYTPQLNQTLETVLDYTDENGNIGTSTTGNATTQSITVRKGDYFTITTDALKEAQVIVNGVAQKLFQMLGDVGQRYGIISPVAAALLGNPERLIFNLVDNTQVNIKQTLADMIDGGTRVHGPDDERSRTTWTLSGNAAVDFILESGTRLLMNSFVMSNGGKM